MTSTSQAVADWQPRESARAYEHHGQRLRLLVAGVGVWLIGTSSTRRRRPSRSIVLGLCNGALYALIALGYTLVYGIIELINFAHGDLFMLGSIFAAVMIADVFGQTSVGRRCGWLAFAHHSARGDGLLRLDQRRGRALAYRRLRQAPKLAPLITAVGISASSSSTSAPRGTARPRSRATRCCRAAASRSAASTSTWTYLIVARASRSRC